MCDEIEEGTVDLVKTEFRWKIKDFSSKMSMKIGTYLYSPDFKVELPDNRVTEWYMIMYPAGQNESSKDYIGLHLTNHEDTKITVAYSLGFLKENTCNVHNVQSMEKSDFERHQRWGYSRFLEKKTITENDSVLIDDTLIIVCEIATPGFHEDGGDNKEKMSAFRYYEELLKNGKFSDVTVVLGKKRVPLHKSVLSSISPVFQAMFDHDMEENNKNIVVIKDIRANVAMEMFRYMYCREVKNLKTIAADLLVAADKYSITRLKKICEKNLLDNLSMDNVCERLMLVTLYETTSLKSKVIDFVVSNLTKLVKTPEYRKLSMECKDEIIMAMAKKED